MLSRVNRMRHGAEFGLAMRKGRRAGREALSVIYLAGSGGEDDTAPPRVGFIVSKAVGNAVVRKRVQRRLRHLMRDRLPALGPGSLLVVRAKPLAALHAYTTLAAQLDGALGSATRPEPTRRRRGRDGDRTRDLRAGSDLAK